MLKVIYVTKGVCDKQFRTSEQLYQLPKGNHEESYCFACRRSRATDFED